MCHLEYRINAKAVGVVAVLVAGRDHQQAEADDFGESVSDLIWRTRIPDAVGQTIGHAQSLLDFAQDQDTAVRRQQAAIEFRDHGLARDR